MSQPTRVSLRDIARVLGISHATVSLALRDHPRISLGLRKKIQQTATEMQYRPDPMLAALASYKKSKGKVHAAGVLAWVNCWPEPARLRCFPEFDGYWNGAVATALKFGFELEEFACDGGLPPDRLQRVLYARGITGILLPPHPVSPDWGDFNWSEFSVVRFGYSCRTPEVQVVTSDEVRNAMLAMRHIRSLRYKRIGLVIGEVTEDRGGLIRAGFYAGHSEAELKQRLPVLIIAHSKALTGPRPELSIWLETYRPEAILTDQAAILKMLNEVGWRVPQDVGVVSCSVPGGDADAGINQNAEEIGRAAVAALISAINEGKRGMPETMSQVLIGGSWVDGASLPGLGTTKS